MTAVGSVPDDLILKGQIIQINMLYLDPNKAQIQTKLITHAFLSVHVHVFYHNVCSFIEVIQYDRLPKYLGLFYTLRPFTVQNKD